MPHGDSKASSDEQLACRAQGGCMASFEELVRRFQCPLLQFLQRTGAGDHAEDLLQDTFIRAYANLHRYRAGERFAPWLFTIARRLGINHYRRSKSMGNGEPLGGLESREPCPAQQALEADDRTHLWRVAAETLGKDEMTIVWLFYVEGMSAREIAAVVARSWVSVKTALFRARRKLLKALEGLEFDAPSPDLATYPHKRPQAALEVESPHV